MLFTKPTRVAGYDITLDDGEVVVGRVCEQSFSSVVELNGRFKGGRRQGEVIGEVNVLYRRVVGASYATAVGNVPAQREDCVADAYLSVCAVIGVNEISAAGRPIVERTVVNGYRARVAARHFKERTLERVKRRVGYLNRVHCVSGVVPVEHRITITRREVSGYTVVEVELINGLSRRALHTEDASLKVGKLAISERQVIADCHRIRLVDEVLTTGIFEAEILEADEAMRTAKVYALNHVEHRRRASGHTEEYHRHPIRYLDV